MELTAVPDENGGEQGEEPRFTSDYALHLNGDLSARFLFDVVRGAPPSARLIAWCPIVDMYRIQSLTGEDAESARAENLEAVLRAMDPPSTFRYYGEEPFQWPPDAKPRCFVHFGMPPLFGGGVKVAGSSEQAWGDGVGLISSDACTTFEGKKVVLHLRSPRYCLLNARYGIGGADGLTIILHPWKLRFGPRTVDGKEVITFEREDLHALIQVALQGVASQVVVTVVNLDGFAYQFGGEEHKENSERGVKYLQKWIEDLVEEGVEQGVVDYHYRPVYPMSEVRFLTALEYSAELGWDQAVIESAGGWVKDAPES